MPAFILLFLMRINDQYELTSTEIVPSTIPVYYNLFIGKTEDLPWVSKLVREQLESTLIEGIHGPVLINLIGPVSSLSALQLPPTMDTRLLRHYRLGDEVLTLHDLWEYCRQSSTHPQQKVIYLHSKGSFHPHKDNDRLRAYLTRGALSRECSTMDQNNNNQKNYHCNVCSSRMSPLPHPHTPGNMWLARCDYVRKLMDPNQFRVAMARVMEKLAIVGIMTGCMGTGRFSVEHWVHSHPMVQPCDVDGSSRYVWNYKGIPGLDFQLELQPAPRFRPFTAYVIPGVCTGVNNGTSLQERLTEYEVLYKETPPNGWFGWDFYELP
jgi:hypothetical protein